MNLDRPLDIAALAEQFADRDMRFNGFGIDFERANKGFNRLIRLFIEEVIQANKVLTVQGAAMRFEHEADFDRLTPTKKPANP